MLSGNIGNVVLQNGFGGDFLFGAYGNEEIYAGGPEMIS
jgi:hypothetical protein